jgi:signal transduction histidine kinase/ActR/RegA family two-component response regulator
MVDSERARLLRLAFQNERLLQELRERQARFQHLLEITHELTRTQAQEDILLRRITQHAAEVLAADAVGVLLPEDGVLALRGTLGDAAALFGDAAPEDTRSRLATALKTSDAVLLPGVGRVRLGLAVPLRAAWQVIGVLALARTSSRPFSVDDVLVATTFATHAATALENARVYREVLEADRRKDDFLARLAHELRNPLAPIVNALHLLGRVGTAGPNASELQAIISRQARRLGTLVDDLLDVSRIRLGKLTVNLEPVDLREIARRCFEALQLSDQVEGHTLSMSLPSEPVPVNGDPARLEQVVANLLNNAVKYTPEGKPIYLTVERMATEAILSVRDSGIGIAPDTLPHVFKLFTQADGAVPLARGGLGLGLALVRALVERHGGVVTAASAGIGHGSTFTVRLPLTQLSLAKDTTEWQETTTRSGRILVLEDDPDAREALRAVLEAAGHRVAVAADGVTAIEVATFFRPECALLDIGLPGMDGYEVARRLRRLPDGKSTWLVALTGYSQPEDIHRAREAGFNSHLVKPVAPETVLDLVAHVQTLSD